MTASLQPLETCAVPTHPREEAKPMIAKLRPYPEYKESGLPWLDSVPKHWEMIPNRALIQEQRRVVGENAKDHTLLSLTLRGVIARDMVNPKGKFPAQFSTYKVVEPGDFVFCLFDIDETPRGVGLSALQGMITGAYDVFRPRQITNPRFLYYYYLFVDDGKLMKPFYTGLRKTIQRGVFASLKAPCPPPEEQDAIVRFLDHVGRRIDKAIRAKLSIMALLNEQKQAIIHRAVTCGVDANVPLRASGIPWLGDIPAHWEMRKLKHLARLKSGEGITAFQIEEKGPYPVFGGGGHRGYTSSYTHDGHFVLIGRQGALCGNIKYSHGKFFASEHAVVATPITEYNVVWFGELLRIMNLNQYSQSAAQPGLSVERIQNLWTPYPPRAEQDRIVSGLQQQTSRQDVVLQRTERELGLLREYRTRLVADVVTGKLDVRAAAGRLSDEPEESEPTSDEVEPDERSDLQLVMSKGAQ